MTVRTQRSGDEIAREVRTARLMRDEYPTVWSTADATALSALEDELIDARLREAAQAPAVSW